MEVALVIAKAALLETCVSPRASGLRDRAAHRARFFLSSGCMSIGIPPLGPVSCLCPFTVGAKRGRAAEHVMIGDATVNRLWRALKARSRTERVLEGLNFLSLGTFPSRPPGGSSWRFHHMCDIRTHCPCRSVGVGFSSSHQCETSSRGCGNAFFDRCEEGVHRSYWAQLAWNWADLLLGGRPDG